MKPTPASLLSALTMPGRDEPWLPGDGAFRIVANPRLGLPLVPFVVLETSIEPGLMQPGWRILGTGASGNTDVDGEAWVVLSVPSDDHVSPGYVLIDLQFDDPPEVAVVRGIGDKGLGIVTRSAEPYRLAAPAISVLRIRGRCRVNDVRIATGFLDFHVDNARALALPVDASWPQYHGTFDPRGEARERVRANAPQAPGPHEEDRGEDPADREERRVSILVDGWLMSTLESVLARPIEQRFEPSRFDDVAGRPHATRADVDDFAAISVATTDPGIARWLGFADGLHRSSANPTMLTVAGVWALPAHHELTSVVSAINDGSEVRGFLLNVLNEQVVADLDQLGEEMQLLWAWTQAWIDFDVIPDRPPPPTLAVGSPAIWRAGKSPDGDVAALPIKTREVALMGSLGVRVGESTPPVHAPLDGAPGLLRPLLAHHGTAFATTFVTPFGTQQFIVQQSDAFGRWSNDANSLEVPPPARPGLATPEPVIIRTAGLPSGDEPWVPRFEVRVPIPARTPGQPHVHDVAVTCGGARVTMNISGEIEVSCDIDGPPIEAGGRAVIEVLVEFSGTPQSTSGATRSIPVMDPRPPKPPQPAPVLRFTARADGTGTAAAVVPLLPGANITAYHIEVANEADLVKAAGAAPAPGSTREQRAQFWLQQPRATLTSAFYRLSPEVVPIASGMFTHLLPGDLEGLVAYRLVPVGGNGASAAPDGCPIVLYAVPRAIVPPPPLLSIDRMQEPPKLVIESRPGGVEIVEHRLRILNSPDSDPRTGRVIASGPIVGGINSVPLPELRPFTRVVFVAEVRGADERGADPMPGRWSRPSNLQAHLAVPDGPPDFITSAHRDGTGVVVVVDPDRRPAVLSDHAALLYRRDSVTGVMKVWRGPIILEERMDDGTGLPADDMALTVIDPLGRRSATIPVIGP